MLPAWPTTFLPIQKSSAFWNDKFSKTVRPTSRHLYIPMPWSSTPTPHPPRLRHWDIPTAHSDTVTVRPLSCCDHRTLRQLYNLSLDSSSRQIFRVSNRHSNVSTMLRPFPAKWLVTIRPTWQLFYYFLTYLQNIKIHKTSKFTKRLNSHQTSKFTKHLKPRNFYWHIHVPHKEIQTTTNPWISWPFALT